MMIEYKNQLKYMRYLFDKTRSYSKTKGSTYHKYCNDIFTFDIETTSSWLQGDTPIEYRKGESSEFWNKLQPLALCYIWQFSFNDRVYYGRELCDFEAVLNDLPKDMDIIIWVHNLAFEFHFLCNFLEWESVFARTPHKPIKCVPKKYPNIEFRCSYTLTRLSLDAWGQQIGCLKAVGDLDYDIMRTPLSRLSVKEMYYCEQDCRVVYEGIKKYRKEYGSVRNIPLTQTGTVRRVVKDMLVSDKDYLKHVKKLVPIDANQYQMLMDVFAGGYTHANRFFAGRVVQGYIEHYDFASSYPTVMIAERYPDTAWCEYTNGMPKESMFEEYAFIFKIKFTNIKCVKFNTYIQMAKSETVNPVLDNGRVMRASELTTTITEQDYLTIKETYKWENMELLECYYSYKRYLPRQLIKYILELYRNKTSLKDVEGQEDLYMQSKQYINSLYGMSVTAIVQPNVLFEDGEWSIEPLTIDYVNNKLEELSNWQDREKRYFLSYSYGCWVTAYARRNLWKCINSCDKEVLYCDTDSIFVLGKHNFDWYNEEITNKLKKSCMYNCIDFELTRPKTKKGKEKPLGIFAQEEPCSEFITLGAKRYCERRIADGQLHLTVSGINKEAVSILENDINNFKDGLDFDKDYKDVKKKLATYVQDMPTVVYPDGYISTYTQGINLRNNGYLLTITNEYNLIMQYSKSTIDDLSDDAIIKLKAIF